LWGCPQGFSGSRSGSSSGINEVVGWSMPEKKEEIKKIKNQFHDSHDCMHRRMNDFKPQLQP
jgi:hypothetical protein